MKGNYSTVLLAILAGAIILTGCGGRGYVQAPVVADDLRARADTEVDGPMRVSATVPGREETEAIFGLDLYDQGIQPVWIEIENSGDALARYAPVSTDPFYFSPLEVAYKNRGGYSDEARELMARFFDASSLPRYIDPGETRSGFVFTHADLGAKGFNVDLFSGGESYHFTFLMRVPGFVPDYADVDFDSMYGPDQLSTVDSPGLYRALKALPCCSTNPDGNPSDGTLNVVLIGAGRDLLRALLRSRWVETSAAESAVGEPEFLFGRQQDAIFRYESLFDDSVYELRLWLAPLIVDEERVWIAKVRHFFSTNGFRRADPDIDNARGFALQNLLYGQALKKLAWISGEEMVPVQSFWAELVRPAFFSDGYRAVLWLSGNPVSLLDAAYQEWDDPPGMGPR